MTTTTETPSTRRKLRAILHAQYTIALLLLLICAVIGAGLVYGTYISPDTQTEERPTASLSVTSQYTHSATVSESNSIFPVGAELTDRDTYFTRIAPVLDVRAETIYASTDARDLTVEHDAELVVRNVDGGTVYWEETESLSTSETSGLDSGEQATTSFSIDTEAVADRIDAIESELGSSPGSTESSIVTTISVSGSVGGETVDRSTAITMELTPGADTYSVSDPGQQTANFDQTETVTVTESYGPLRTVGGPLLVLFGIGGAALLVTAQRRGVLELTAAERAHMEFLDDRSEFDDWITRIQLPAVALDLPMGRARSLEDLVDFAIDNDVAVVEDPDSGVFYAVTGEYVYTYAPPVVPEEATGGLLSAVIDGSPADSETAQPSDSDESNLDPSAETR